MNTAQADTKPVALVTGASQGIGSAIAKALASDGYRVAVNFCNSADKATETVAAIRDGGGIAVPFQADVSQQSQVVEMVKQIEAELGAINILVNNAGIMHTQFLAMTSPEDWRRVMAANLDASFYVTKAVIRPMVRARAGRIIFISSDAGLMGDLMRAAYSASKSGLLGLAKSTAREVATSGITVNVVSPGMIDTAMTSDIPETRRNKMLAQIPLQRFGRAEEVANVVRFLASADAAYITGQTICVDGGLYMQD